MYKQKIIILTNMTKGYSVVGCYITLLFTCLHLPYPPPHTDHQLVSVSLPTHFMAFNKQQLTQHNRKPDGTEFTSMKTRYECNTRPAVASFT